MKATDVKNQVSTLLDLVTELQNEVSNLRKSLATDGHEFAAHITLNVGTSVADAYLELCSLFHCVNSNVNLED